MRISLKLRNLVGIKIKGHHRIGVEYTHKFPGTTNEPYTKTTYLSQSHNIRCQLTLSSIGKWSYVNTMINTDL